DLPQRLVQQRDEAVDIDRRPAARDGPEDQVALAVEGRLQLGEAAVTHPLLGTGAFAPAAHVVVAGCAAVEAGRVQGRAAGPPAAAGGGAGGAAGEAGGAGGAAQGAGGPGAGVGTGRREPTPGAGR